MVRANIIRAGLLIAALPALLGTLDRRPRFVVPVSVKASTQPSFEADLLPQVATRFVHGATISELPNGDLAAAWYGGTDETARDVRIFLSVRSRVTGEWSPPRVVEDRAHAQHSLRLRVKSLGNPVLFSDTEGMRLFFVAVVAGGWSGSTICFKHSKDGVRWTDAEHVITSPLLNLGTLVRGAPASWDDGTIALPVYHQLAGKWSAIARVDRTGRVLDQLKIEDDRPLIQPWIVVTGPRDALALLRYSSKRPYCVTIARSHDAGAHWRDVEGTPLVHRDSGVAGTLLDDGSLLALYNNTAWDRRDLSAARSTDGAVHWSKPHPIERDTTPDSLVRREYSYPYVLRTHDGNIHIVYTWQRTRIRHVTFNTAWIRTNPNLSVMR